VSWHRYLLSVEVRLPGIPVALGVVEEEGREIVSVELTVRCHRTGETIKVRTRRPVMPLALMTEAEAEEVVRDLVRIAMLHEIDEAITINGARPFDPHERLT
jgi:hypothetical protein